MVLEGGCLNRDAELKVKVWAETKASPESGGILCASSKIWKTSKGSLGSLAVLAQQHDQKKKTFNLLLWLNFYTQNSFSKHSEAYPCRG